MKKSYFLMAAAAALFAACSETDFVNEAAVVEGNAPQAIGFETFSYKATRQTSSTDLNAYYKNFRVFGWEGDVNFMQNVQVTYGGDPAEWSYSPLEYWTNATYQFYAVAPYNANVTCTEKTGNVAIPEAANATAATQNLQTTLSTTLNTGHFTTDTDWLLAKETDYTVASGATVGLEFTHMMSKFIVAIQKGDGAETVKIKSITISDNNSKLWSKATYANPTWTGNTDVDLTVSYDGEGATVEDDLNYAMEYLVVPTTGLDLRFSMTYTVNGLDKTASNVVVKNIEDFVAGSVYKLTATIGSLPIKFSATVTPWTDGVTDGVTITN